MSARFRAARMLALAWVLLAAGCEDDDCNPDYHADPEACSICVTPPPDCSSAIPSASPLSIHLSQPLPKWVRIYSGKAYETGTLVQTVVPTARDFSVLLPSGAYSVTALYVAGTDSVLAVDGGDLDYRDIGACGRTCLEPVGDDVDVKKN